jgi:hypothetical protein
MVERHSHNGSDSERLDPNNFLGFPVAVSAPTDSAPNGTIRLAIISGTAYIYARINNTWVKATLS